MIQALVRVKILNVYFLIMHQNEQHKRKKKSDMTAVYMSCSQARLRLEGCERG